MEKLCTNCGNLYTTNKKYSNAQVEKSLFCSNKCKLSVIHKERKKDRGFSTCPECKNNFPNLAYKKTYCSIKCSQVRNKINDGLTNSERNRRINGMLKSGTSKHRKKISVATKLGMDNDETRAKLRSKRGKLTLKHRQKLSDVHKGKMPKNNNQKYGNIRSGYYENSKGKMFFRSMWEANYALYLDFLVRQRKIKGWDFEADTFMFEKIKLGTRSYKPDFKVTLNNGSIEYHEVKGWMDAKSKTKLNRMRIYYPKVKIVLVDSNYYKDVRDKLGRTLNFYA